MPKISSGVESVWPRGKKCAVCLSFDVDGETMWLARDPDNAKRAGLMSQGEYGPRVAVPRILKLLEKHALKATFFIPGWIAEKYRDMVREIHAAGHEIGHHGYLHEWISHDMQIEKEKEILDKGLSPLLELTGEKPLGYRSPAGEFSVNTFDLLLDYGFIYESTLMNDEIPYVLKQKAGRKLVEIPFHWVLDDAPFFNWTLRYHNMKTMASPSAVYEIWRSEFDGFYREARCYVLTMHPQIIGRPSRVQMLDRLVSYMKKKPDVWFARLVDVAKYWIKTQT